MRWRDGSSDWPGKAKSKPGENLDKKKGKRFAEMSARADGQVPECGR